MAATGIGATARGQLPLGAKLAYTAWMAVWVPLYWIHVGPQNFLWLCDLANFVVALAMWTESPLLFSSQAVGTLLVQTAWAVDYLGRLFVGNHPYGGTEYMFNPATPFWLRTLSLFHLAMPPLLLWAVWRLGYHCRGWWLQTALTWVLLPATFLLADPERNINWVWRPFGVEQNLLTPWGYLSVCLLAYPLLLYLPTHLILEAWARRTAGRPALLGRAKGRHRPWERQPPRR